MVDNAQNAESVMVVRFFTGDEVIGKVSAYGTNHMIIKKPAAIVMQPGTSGKASMGLLDYLPMAKNKEIVISSANVLFVYEPMVDIENAYNTSFGSGLVIPKSSLTL
jgi:hypothetical protein